MCLKCETTLGQEFQTNMGVLITIWTDLHEECLFYGKVSKKFSQYTSIYINDSYVKRNRKIFFLSQCNLKCWNKFLPKLFLQLEQWGLGCDEKWENKQFQFNFS